MRKCRIRFRDDTFAGWFGMMMVESCHDELGERLHAHGLLRFMIS